MYSTFMFLYPILRTQLFIFFVNQISVHLILILKLNHCVNQIPWNTSVHSKWMIKILVQYNKYAVLLSTNIILNLLNPVRGSWMQNSLESSWPWILKFVFFEGSAPTDIFPMVTPSGVIKNSLAFFGNFSPFGAIST